MGGQTSRSVQGTEPAALSRRLCVMGDPHALYLAAGPVWVDWAGTRLGSGLCLDLPAGEISGGAPGYVR